MYENKDWEPDEIFNNSMREIKIILCCIVPYTVSKNYTQGKLFLVSTKQTSVDSSNSKYSIQFGCCT